MTLEIAGHDAGGWQRSRQNWWCLSDAVNALVQTVDAETRQPVFLAATNLGLVPQFRSHQGLAKIALRLQLRSANQLYFGGSAASGNNFCGYCFFGRAWFRVMAGNRGSACPVFPLKLR